MDVEVDSKECTITLNLGAFICDQLNDEGRAALMADTIAYELAYSEIERLLKEDHASPGYNAAVHDLRERFLTGEEAPEHVRQMVRTLLDEIERQKLRVRKAQERSRALRQYLRDEHDDLGPHIPYDSEISRSPTDEEVDAVVAGGVCPACGKERDQ